MGLRSTKPKMKKTIIIIALEVLLGVGLVLVAWRLSLLPQEVYGGEDFEIERVVSEIDYDGDGIDDYLDIMLGARMDVENHPRYDGSYVMGGYPADDVGVCTDVIWRALKNAGYSLKDMIDEDIAEHPEDYPWIEVVDPNIDFRRVKNIERFLEKYAEKLTNDITEIEEWQPGDIVILQNGNHIGIVSDKRSETGRTYIIHNGGQPVREEDFLQWDTMPVGHYRWNLKK